MKEFSLRISLNDAQLSLHCPDLDISWDEGTAALSGDYPRTMEILRDEILAAVYDKIRWGEISEEDGINLLGGKESYLRWYSDRTSQLSWEWQCSRTGIDRAIKEMP